MNRPIKTGGGTTTRRAVVGWVLLLALGFAGAAARGQTIPLAPPSIPPGGWPGECAQACFEQYTKNAERCKLLFCHTFLFFTWCEDPAYGQCLKNGQEVFEKCMQDCV